MNPPAVVQNASLSLAPGDDVAQAGGAPSSESQGQLPTEQRMKDEGGRMKELPTANCQPLTELGSECRPRCWTRDLQEYSRGNRTVSKQPMGSQ